MSSTAIAWALYEAPKVDPTARLILVHLAEHADRYGCGTFPSVPTIAEDLEVSVPTVRRHLKTLETDRLISRGDQRLVSHYSADRRPVVWNLSLSIKKPPKRDRRDLSPVTPRRSPRPITHDTPRPIAGDTPTGSNGVSPADERPITGAHHDLSPAIAKPSTEPKTEPPPPAQAREADDGGGGGTVEVLGVLNAVGESLGLPSPAPLARLAPGVAAVLGADWQPDALARHLAAGLPPAVEKPTAFLGHRLAALPPSPDACDCRACVATVRSRPKPATCLTHRTEIPVGETCVYCDTAADAARRRAEQGAEERQRTEADRRRKLADLAERLGPEALRAVTGRMAGVESGYVRGKLLSLLDEYGGDIDKILTLVAGDSAQPPSPAVTTA